jgi:hypothetical protein
MTMVSKDWEDDDLLLADLREALRSVVPPPEVVSAAKDCYTWRTIDDELAMLEHDSVLDDDGLVSVRRTTSAHRTLIFEAGEMSIEVEVTGKELVGQVLPPGSGQLEVQRAFGDTVEVSVDHLGRFFVSPMPDGPIRMRYSPPDGARIATSWTVLAGS